MDAVARSRRVKELARTLGFDRCGIASPDPVERAPYYRNWLDAGRAGTMAYLHRHVPLRTDARALEPGTRAVIVVALRYRPRPEDESAANAATTGRIARYAWGEDYHVVVRDKLEALVERMRAEFNTPFAARICVDTAPLLEREYAARAGIGWIGKNTLVLHQELGSYFFLGEILTDLELAFERPVVDHCGSCRRCLEACPTKAFPQPYEMDASRCLSYLTIEHRGEELPEAFRGRLSGWLFGCDICQEVCPFNRSGPPTSEPRFAVREPAPAIAPEKVLAWSPDDYRRLLKGSAMKRAKLAMLQRNARALLDTSDR